MARIMLLSIASFFLALVAVAGLDAYTARNPLAAQPAQFVS